MSSIAIDLPRLLLASLAAGIWVVVSGMLMAGAFGYRDMNVAFKALGLKIPSGVRPLIFHSVVRILTGIMIVTLFAISSQVLDPLPAALVSAGIAWVIGQLLPYAVIAEWGVLPWSTVVKVSGWGVGELLVAALIGMWLYPA